MYAITHESALLLGQADAKSKRSLASGVLDKNLPSVLMALANLPRVTEFGVLTIWSEHLTGHIGLVENRFACGATIDGIALTGRSALKQLLGITKGGYLFRSAMSNEQVELDQSLNIDVLSFMQELTLRDWQPARPADRPVHRPYHRQPDKPSAVELFASIPETNPLAAESNYHSLFIDECRDLVQRNLRHKTAQDYIKQGQVEKKDVSLMELPEPYSPKPPSKRTLKLVRCAIAAAGILFVGLCVVQSVIALSSGRASSINVGQSSQSPAPASGSANAASPVPQAPPPVGSPDAAGYSAVAPAGYVASSEVPTSSSERPRRFRDLFTDVPNQKKSERTKPLASNERLKDQVKAETVVTIEAKQQNPEAAAFPEHETELITAGYRCLSLHQPGQAVRFFEEAVRRNPNNGLSRQYLAHAAFANRDYAKAISQFEAMTTKKTASDIECYASALSAVGQGQKAAQVMSWLRNQK